MWYEIVFSFSLFCRFSSILQICANHAITPEMTLRPMVGSEKAFVWFTPGIQLDLKANESAIITPLNRTNLIGEMLIVSPEVPIARFC